MGNVVTVAVERGVGWYVGYYGVQLVMIAVVVTLVIVVARAMRGRRISEEVVGADGSPPGWYADPNGSSRLRWWDGENWTEHVT